MSVTIWPAFTIWAFSLALSFFAYSSKKQQKKANRNASLYDLGLFPCFKLFRIFKQEAAKKGKP